MTKGTRAARTYGQYCPVAVGLDLLGDRWVLLILRELATGDQRFSDLRRGLPGIAPNLLSDRLQQLSADGMVESVELPPPAARSVYRLTADGRAAIPVLRAVARFGVRHLDGEPPETLSARRTGFALLAPWSTPTDADLRARLVLTEDSRRLDDGVDVVLGGGTFRFEDTEPSSPVPVDVTLEIEVEDLVAVRRDQGSRGVPALRVAVTGPAARADEVLAAFALTRARGRARPS